MGLTERERFVLAFLLRKLNEYAASVGGQEVAIPDKKMQEAEKARARNLSDDEKKELVDDIKEEMLVTDSFLATACNGSELPGDEKLV